MRTRALFLNSQKTKCEKNCKKILNNLSKKCLAKNVIYLVLVNKNMKYLKLKFFVIYDGK